METTDIVNFIYNIERKLNLFDLYTNETYVWKSLRYDIFQKLAKQKNLFKEAHIQKKPGIISKVNIGASSIRNYIFKNPYLSPKKKIVFLGHSRRKKMNDNQWWDIYCDLIIEKLEQSYVLWEGYHIDHHLTPPKTNNIRYLDFISLLATIKNTFNYKEVKFNQKNTEIISNIQNEIFTQFDARLDLISMIKFIIKKKKSYHNIFRKLLKKIDPSLMIILVSYSVIAETLVEACKELKIPVIELQHGILSPLAVQYNFPPGINYTNNIPDYFFVFSNYWKSLCKLPISENNIISVGYPHFESERDIYIKKYSRKSNQIVFVSQGPIGEKLSKFAVELNSILNNDYDLVYKMHPGEFERWKSEYPWLLKSSITVIQDEKNIYQIFAESDIQIGVYSMALYEGLGFGLRTLVLNTIGIEFIRPLIDLGYVGIINSPNDTLKFLKSENDSKIIEQNLFFMKNSIENIVREINKILSI